MTIPTWAGSALSPLWGVGKELPLEIQSGADWEIPFYVFAADGITPLVFTDPVLEMRRDRTFTSQFLAHLDTTGTSNGLITVLEPGHWVLSMTAEQTSALPTGRGFWDCFGKVEGKLTPVASGIVVIKPRVTGNTGLPLPPPVPQPPLPVVEEPTIIDIGFPAGDDYEIDLTLDEGGAPMDLSASMVDAYVQTGDERQRLTDFAVVIDGTVLHLSLTEVQTGALPPFCSWECKLTIDEDTTTIAKGSVRVS